MHQREPINIEMIITVCTTAFAIVLLAVLCRSCENSESSYQQCINTHAPLECAAAQSLR